MERRCKTLPNDIVNNVLQYDGRFVMRNGKMMGKLDKKIPNHNRAIETPSQNTF